MKIPAHESRRGASAEPTSRVAASELVQPTVRRWVAQDILCGAPEAEIEHGEAVYRLRLTSQGKLILTK